MPVDRAQRQTAQGKRGEPPGLPQSRGALPPIVSVPLLPGCTGTRGTDGVEEANELAIDSGTGEGPAALERAARGPP